MSGLRHSIDEDSFFGALVFGYHISLVCFLAGVYWSLWKPSGFKDKTLLEHILFELSSGSSSNGNRHKYQMIGLSLARFLCSIFPLYSSITFVVIILYSRLTSISVLPFFLLFFLLLHGLLLNTWGVVPYGMKYKCALENLLLEINSEVRSELMITEINEGQKQKDNRREEKHYLDKKSKKRFKMGNTIFSKFEVRLNHILILFLPSMFYFCLHHSQFWKSDKFLLHISNIMLLFNIPIFVGELIKNNVWYLLVKWLLKSSTHEYERENENENENENEKSPLFFRFFKLLIPTLILVICFEYRVIFTSYSHLIFLPAPFSYFFLTVFLGGFATLFLYFLFFILMNVSRKSKTIVFRWNIMYDFGTILFFGLLFCLLRPPVFVLPSLFISGWSFMKLLVTQKYELIPFFLFSFSVSVFWIISQFFAYVNFSTLFLSPSVLALLLTLLCSLSLILPILLYYQRSGPASKYLSSFSFLFACHSLCLYIVELCLVVQNEIQFLPFYVQFLTGIFGARITYMLFKYSKLGVVYLSFCLSLYFGGLMSLLVLDIFFVINCSIFFFAIIFSWSTSARGIRIGIGRNSNYRNRNPNQLSNYFFFGFKLLFVSSLVIFSSLNIVRNIFVVIVGKYPTSYNLYCVIFILCILAAIPLFNDIGVGRSGYTNRIFLSTILATVLLMFNFSWSSSNFIFFCLEFLSFVLMWWCIKLSKSSLFLGGVSFILSLITASYFSLVYTYIVFGHLFKFLLIIFLIIGTSE